MEESLSPPLSHISNGELYRTFRRNRRWYDVSTQFLSFTLANVFYILDIAMSELLEHSSMSILAFALTFFITLKYEGTSAAATYVRSVLFTT